MKRLIAALILALITIVAFAPSANAAHRVGPYRYYLWDDDETNAYTKNRGSLNYAVSRSFYVAESYSHSIQPYRHRRINCNNEVIDTFTVNIGRIGNTNPRPVTKNCSPRGVNFFIDFKNQVIWKKKSRVDRCADVVVTVRKRMKAPQYRVTRRYTTLCLP